MGEPGKAAFHLWPAEALEAGWVARGVEVFEDEEEFSFVFATAD